MTVNGLKVSGGANKKGKKSLPLIFLQDSNLTFKVHQSSFKFYQFFCTSLSAKRSSLVSEFTANSNDDEHIYKIRKVKWRIL